MNAKKNILAYLLSAAVALTAFSFNIETVYADIQVPDSIRIGMAFGQAGTNIFSVTSGSGLQLSIYESGKYRDLLEIGGASGIRVRKDEYYNVINGVESEIDYVRAAKYEGEVIGPYHIQVGDTYGDIEKARYILNRVASVTPSVFLAYEDGWRVWSQLYLDENECLNQIKIMQSEMGDLKYSVVYPDRKRLHIIDNATGQMVLAVNSEEKVKASPKTAKGASGIFQYKGKQYRGSITMQSLEESDITVVNELPFDEYLYSVVPSEMPCAWPMEALKAQAVAARNYAMATRGKHNAYGFDLCSGEHCQAYKGIEQENANTTAAVAATKGKIITYNGELITAFFHSTSGGHTEDSENIWGTRTDYIRGVDDKYSYGSPYDNWTLEMDRATLKDKLTQAGIDLGDITGVNILEVSSFGRVLSLEVVGSKETKVFEREKIRNILGTTTLRSIWYKVTTDADIFVRGSMLANAEQDRASGLYVVTSAGKSKVGSTARTISARGMYGSRAYKAVPSVYTFQGKGFGHGLGMSQYGAKGMAEAGNNYEEILEHYYQGAVVQ
ncbi:MAG: SpoIID/LytB domain-containing protein [Pseudomonadota bacterium]